MTGWVFLHDREMADARISVQVRQVSGESCTVSVGKDGTLSDLHAAIYARCNVPPEAQRLVFRGAPLQVRASQRLPAALCSPPWRRCSVTMPQHCDCDWLRSRRPSAGWLRVLLLTDASVDAADVTRHWKRIRRAHGSEEGVATLH
jgi:hypothetical protein